MNCPMCGGPPMELGTLGSRKHYRCRNCGMDFSKNVPTKKPISSPPRPVMKHGHKEK